MITLIAFDNKIGTSKGKLEGCFPRTDAIVLNHKYMRLPRETF